jgi:hypothetical protein
MEVAQGAPADEEAAAAPGDYWKTGVIEEMTEEEMTEENPPSNVCRKCRRPIDDHDFVGTPQLTCPQWGKPLKPLSPRPE